MAVHSPDASADASTDPAASLGSLIVDDLRRTRFRRRDMRALYEFYVDEERRAQVAAMGRLRGWVYITAFLLRSLYLKLPRERRSLLLIALVFAVLSSVELTYGSLEIRQDLRLPAFVLLLFILMLELRDKVLARDELAVGREVQLALLPREAPQVPGWSLWLYTRPANDVGGDLVDALPLDGGRTGLALGDVAGKGLGAALLMSKLQATLRALAPGAPELATLGARMNTILLRDGLPNRFATLAYLELAPHGGTVRLLNAGHLPPVLVRDGETVALPPAALPLGMWPEAAYLEQDVALAPGDAMLLFSDGLTEARNAAGRFFGEDRLPALLPALRGLPAEEIGRRLLVEVTRFAGEEPFGDDLSIVIVQRLDGAADPAAFTEEGVTR